jgi:hypothetical protein
MSTEVAIEECWECGARAGLRECDDCNDGTEYCSYCYENHRALEHDEDYE